MADHYDQNDAWDLTPFYSAGTLPFGFDSKFQAVATCTSFQYESIESTMSPRSIFPESESAATPISGWVPSTSRLSSDSTSHDMEQSCNTKILLEPQPGKKRRARKPPHGAALERRRQQNRASQLAFRERTKKQMGELRQELAQSTEYNKKIYRTMQQLLERTESLKIAIEGALATPLPGSPADYSRPNTTEYGTPPQSSTEESNPTLESPSL